MLIAISLGTVIGSVAGFFGGKIDQVLMRVVDLFLALPVLPLLLLTVYLFRVRRGGPDAETSAGWRRNPPATDLGVWRTWAASLRAHGGCVLAYCPTTREASRGHAVHEMANGVNEYAPRYTGVRLLTLAAGRIVRSDLSPVGLHRPSPTVAPRDRPTPYIPFSPHNVAPDPGP